MARLAIFCALVFIADDYICTLTTRETSRPPGSGPTIGTTVIEEQLRFADSRETRRITRIDGRPVSPQEAGERPKEMSWGEFGN